MGGGPRSRRRRDRRRQPGDRRAARRRAGRLARRRGRRGGRRPGGAAAYAARTAHDRAEILHRAADLLEGRIDELAAAVTSEQGKPVATEAREEVEETAANLRMAAEDVKRFDSQVIPAETAGKMVFTLPRPNGVFAVITPWNFPLMIPSELVAPALATGNAVVLKPSEYTPLIAEVLVEVLVEAGLPPGVCNLVHGAGLTGDALVTHPGIDAVAFVGSNTAGEAIVRAAGLKRTLIEASGNGPLIVLADADLEAAAVAAVEGASYLAGQVCVATERVLVDRAVHREFVELVTREAAKVTLGDPREPSTTMGPLNNEATAARMDRHVADAVARGAEVLVGGRRRSGLPTDLYYEMTVVDGVTPGTMLFREESFGPVVPITTFATDDEAIALANDSDLGLQAAVFTSSLHRAFRFMHEIRAGNIQINESTGYWEGRPPFGGAAGTRSGWGRIQLDDFTDVRTVTVDWTRVAD
ncbi:MAG: aldehyde dehydrogenase family protein [Acidimicrobiales bacterium]